MSGADETAAVLAARTDADGGAMSKAEARDVLRGLSAYLRLCVYEAGSPPTGADLFRGDLARVELLRLACLKAVAALTRSIKSTKRAKKAGIAKSKAARNADGGAV